MLLNGIKTKYVKRDMKLKEQSNYSSSNFSNKFIVTRILGHPEWGNNYENWKEVHECWIWAKYSFYAIFYNKSVRNLYFHEFDKTDENLKYISQKLYLSNILLKTNREDFSSQEDEEAILIDSPHIAGSFNSWKLSKMMSLQEAWKILDKSSSVEEPDALK